jgi:hypothetical protein
MKGGVHWMQPPATKQQEPLSGAKVVPQIILSDWLISIYECLYKGL